MGRLVGARALALVVALLMTVPALPAIIAEHDGSHAGTLPAPLVGAAAVEWRDGSVFVFGGRITQERFSNEILRHDPATGGVAKVAEFPPSGPRDPLTHREPGRYAGAAAAVGDRIYYFGGAVLEHRSIDGRDALIPQSIPDIVEFDPANGTVRTLDVTLPESAWGLAAAAAHGHVYLFGGLTFEITDLRVHFERHDRILRFAPERVSGSATVKVLSERLPYAVQDAAAARVADTVYVAGGLAEATGWTHVCRNNGTLCPTTGVIRFDTGHERVDGIGRAPERSHFATATATGDVVLVAGGRTSTGDASPRVLVLEPDAPVRALEATLPRASYGMASAAVPTGVFTYGGRDAHGNVTDAISRVDASAGTRDVGVDAPVNLSAENRGDGIRLSWFARDADAFHVYRREAGGDDVSYAGATERSSFDDRDVEAGTRYEYRVVAVSGPFESSLSAPAFAIRVDLTAPVGLVAETAGKYVPGVERTIDLRWSPPEHVGAHPVTGYRVYRSVDGGAWAWLADTPDVTSFTDSDAPTLSDVAYRVTALTSVKESTPSNRAVVTVPDSVLDATPFGRMR